MSIDYRIKICRKEDDKQIGIVHCNYLKNIFDAGFDEYINCESMADKSGARFTVADLHRLLEVAKEKMDSLYDEILKKHLMITLSQSVDVKRDLEYDSADIKIEVIGDLWHVIQNTSYIIGMIDCIVENQYQGDKMAYEYNAEGLPEKCNRSIFIDDVYCIIETC